MSTDFLACLSQDLLNKASAAVFPSLQSKFGGTSTLQNPAAEVSWSVAAAPTFELGQAASTSFSVNLKLSIAVTPQGGTKTAEDVDATAGVATSISGTGTLGLHITDITFAVDDPFLLAVLNAKKSDIASQVDGLLSKIEIPIGPVEGVVFGGYAAGVQGGALYAAGGLTSPVEISPQLNPGSGFQVLLSEALVQRVVQALWWDKTPKSFSTHGATINLYGYSAAVSGGKLVLTLSMGGTYNLGDARWGVNVGPVTATMDFAIKPGNQLWLTNGKVDAPSVSMPPENFWAGLLTGITAGIMDGILVGVFNSELPSNIQGRLDQKLFTVPTLTESFDGIPISATPTGVSISGSGTSLIISGDADIAAS